MNQPHSMQIRHQRWRFAERGSLPALLVMLPVTLVLFGVFVLLPLFDAAQFSFYRWNGFGPLTDFVGLQNYSDVLANKDFSTALRNSLFIVLASVLVQLPLALWCALALAKKSFGTNLARVMFFLPYMLAEVAAGLIWKFVYDGNYGLVPAVGAALNTKLPFVLGDSFWVMPAIMVVVVWKYFGFHMMIYISALQAIPEEVLEAARMEGVSPLKVLLHIKIPMIRSAIVVTMFFAIVGALQLFDLIIPLTNGGPFNSSNTIVSFLYQFGVARMKLGFGGAVSVILFVICVVVTLFYRRILAWGESNT